MNALAKHEGEKSFPKWNLLSLSVRLVKTLSEGFYYVYQCPFKKMKIDLILLTKIEEGEQYTAWVLFYENSLSTFA